MGGVHRRVGDFVDLVQDIEEVFLRVNAAALDGGHNLADDLLPGGGAALVLQAFQIGQQLLMDELPDAGLGVLAQRAIRGGPVAPAVGRFDGGRKGDAEGLGVIGLLRFAFVENAEEENPSEFRDVFHGAGAVGPAHDVANGFDGGVDRLLSGVALAVGGLGGRFGFGGHLNGEWQIAIRGCRGAGVNKGQKLSIFRLAVAGK